MVSAERDAAEWHALRKGRVTSSTVAACLGQDPYCTPLEAYGAITGRGEPFEGNAATERGTLLESVVLDYPTRNGELQRKPAPFAYGEWHGDSTDCFYVDERSSTLLLGEAKTVALTGAEDWGEDGTDDVPPRVAIQALWHLHHWPEADVCLVPILLGGYQFEFRCYRVSRAGNEDVIAALVERAERFHRDHVVAKCPPAAGAGDDAALAWLFPKATMGKLEPTPEAEAALRNYVTAREAAKQAEGLKRAAAAQLKQLLGDHEGVKTECYWASWKEQRGRASVDWQAMAHDLAGGEVSPRLLQRFARLGRPTRVLRVGERHTDEGQA